MTFRKFLSVVLFFIGQNLFAQNDSLIIFSYPKGNYCNYNSCFSPDGLEVSISNTDEIPEEVMSNKELKRITFFTCPLHGFTELVKKLKTFPNLISLGFIECGLSKFPEAFCELTNLRSLTIVLDNISVLPESISKLSNLEFLDLGDPLYGGNSLDTLPDSFSKLSKLRVLYLFGNSFHEFPQVCAQLPLAYLNLSYNNIHDFAPITQIHSLEKLVIYGAPLGKFPQLENLQSLKWLDVSNCELGKETGAFDRLLNLEHLFIGSNPEINAEETFSRLQQLKHLRELDLDNCGLTKLPLSLFNFPALEIVGLSRCGTMDFEQAFSVLSGLANLQELSLRQNDIKRMPDNIALLKNLRVLNLYFNNLKSIGRICELKKLEKLYLVANPLKSVEDCLAQLTFINEIYLPSDLSDADQAKAKRFFPKAEIRFY